MKNSLMVGLIALKDSIYKGDTMKKLIQKWLGIDSLDSNVEYLNLKSNTLEANINQNKLIARNEIAELKESIDKLNMRLDSAQKEIKKGGVSRDELNAYIAQGLESLKELKEKLETNSQEINGIKETLEYHTKDIVTLKQSRQRQARTTQAQAKKA